MKLRRPSVVERRHLRQGKRLGPCAIGCHVSGVEVGASTGADLELRSRSRVDSRSVGLGLERSSVHADLEQVVGCVVYRNEVMPIRVIHVRRPCHARAGRPIIRHRKGRDSSGIEIERVGTIAGAAPSTHQAHDSAHCTGPRPTGQRDVLVAIAEGRVVKDEPLRIGSNERGDVPTHISPSGN